MFGNNKGAGPQPVTQASQSIFQKEGGLEQISEKSMLWLTGRLSLPLILVTLKIAQFILLSLLVIFGLYFPLYSLLIWTGKVPIYMSLSHEGFFTLGAKLPEEIFYVPKLWWIKFQYEPLYFFALAGVYMTPLFFFFFMISDLMLTVTWTLSAAASLLFFSQNVSKLLSTALFEIGVRFPSLAETITALGIKDYSSVLTPESGFEVWFQISLVGLIVPAVYLLRILFEKIKEFTVPFGVKGLRGLNGASGISDWDERRPLEER